MEKKENIVVSVETMNMLLSFIVSRPYQEVVHIIEQYQKDQQQQQMLSTQAAAQKNSSK